MIDLVGLRRGRATAARATFSLGMGQRLGIAAALLGDPGTLILDEPVNGLDPEGIHWMRTLLRGLAAEGRTVLVSSHLMSEMAQTAEHLIVVGRGRLLADLTTDAFVARAAPASVRVRTPDAAALRDLLLGDGVTVRSDGPGVLDVAGLDAAAIGDRAAAAGLAVHELTAAAPVARGGLHGADARRGRVRGGGVSGMSRRDAGARRARGVDQAALAALRPGRAARRRAADRRAGHR